MGKKATILILVTFIFLHQMYLIPNAFALNTCINSGVDFNPKYFPENLSSIDLNFEAKNANTISNSLKKPDGTWRHVRLNMGTGILPGQTSLSQPTTAGATFTISLTDETLRKRGSHWGILEITNDAGAFEGFCTTERYQVGAQNQCQIGPVPNPIPPNTHLTINFFGNANTSYNLSTGQGDAVLNNIIAPPTTTPSDGQGFFSDVPIPGLNGDSIFLTIWNPNGAIETRCSVSITISSTASAPPSSTPTPVTPGTGGTVPAATPCTGANCTKAGGDPCGDPGNPGFKTAIGCIHTNPLEFTKDFLKFIMGIGGGFAFLMMLLGVFQMLTSAGNPETLQAGRERLTSAIVGLLFIIFAVLLMQIIGVDILGLPDFRR